ncbi:serine hydrolase, partial [Kibdelosporangium lantanae]
MSHPQVVANWADYTEERVPIDSLLPADSPRLSGESMEHARMLAASEAELPPIVVHRPTRRVIDGMHRLKAAALRGQDDILVRFYEGDDEDAFIVAVETNIAHGLPLSLADPVEKWLPGRVPNGDAITLRMLLNHTSGLYDYTRDPAIVPAFVGRDPRRWTSLDLLALGVKHDPEFPPGTRTSYSNTNYVAVGAVLERVTGMCLADLVRDRIARPLGLRHTYYAVDTPWRGP